MLRIEIAMNIESSADPIDHAVHKYKLKAADIQSSRIVRRSLDARANRPAVYLYQLDFELAHENEYLRKLGRNARSVQPYVYKCPDCGSLKLEHRPVVVGFGPAGMAAALLLAKKGYCPIVIERGPATEDRKKAVNHYWATGELDPEKNVQFGEGGAGAFSDGKLTTRVKDLRVSVVLDALIEAGADPAVAWMNHPHIGTDKFCDINVNIRKEIERLGGEVRFNTRLSDLVIHNGKLTGIETNHGSITCDVMILAIGHSARDTFEMLHKRMIPLLPKPFAVGVRAEHLQTFIDAQQYRQIRDYSCLPAAEYHLTHTSSTGKGVYSFCMCPGGYVVASTSVPDTIVTNGMSYSKRDGINANSALLVQVGKEDFGDQLFDGMHYQEMLEHRSFQMGKGKGPCQTIENYLGRGSNTISGVKPTYSLGVEMTDLHPLFSETINQSLTEMLEHTEHIFPGFTTGGAIMTGVETRTSSPIRIIRDLKNLEAEVGGIYPCGEGAGYAGGIVSSAIDGIKCAEKIIEKYHM